VTVAGISKLEAIIAQFNETQRIAWLESIASESEEVAMQLGWSPRRENMSVTSSSVGPMDETPVPVTDKNPTSAPVSIAVNQIGQPTVSSVKTPEPDIFDEAITIPIDRFRDTVDHDPVQIASQISQKCKRIESLVLNDLVTLLHACDRDDVILMLKGSTESMRKQVGQVVAPQDLKRFKQLLAGKPPETMEVLQAVDAICEKLDVLIAAGRINPLATSSILVAA
jgi:hypothetical protein